MSFPLLDAFLTMLWFFLWILWIFLLVQIIMDIFRSDDLTGWGKAGWLMLVVLVPLFGVLVYLIAHGVAMHDRRAHAVQAQDEASRRYVRDAAGGGSVDELSKLADLHDRGVLSDAEFERGKVKIFG
jgi:hypothetical protein